MVQAAIDEFGKIDVLVNNAGITTLAEVSEMTEEEWDEVIDVNLKGVFLCSKHVARHMIEARTGKIITTGSIHCFTGVPAAAHYVASKHGVAGFSKALAIELAPYGINVNYVCPTVVNTTMVEILDSGASPRASARSSSRSPAPGTTSRRARRRSSRSRSPRRSCGWPPTRRSSSPGRR